LNSKICPTCNEDKELSEYYTKIRNDGTTYYRRECKKCVAIRSHNWEIQNPEAYTISRNKKESQPARVKYRKEDWIRQRDSGYTSQWQKDNPEKCREYTKNHRSHDITKSEWEECLRIFDYKCAYCNMTLKDHKQKYNQQLHKEHVDCEGENNLSNCVPACRSCNSSKHKNIMEDWYRKQEFFSEERYNKIILWTTEGYKEYIDIKYLLNTTNNSIEFINNVNYC